MPSLLKRLRERKLFQWALAYLAGAWLIFQGIEVLAEPWSLSEAIQRSIHVLLGIGFLVTLVLAWYHGEKGRQKASGVELLILAGILVIAGAAVALLGRAREAGEEGVAARFDLSPRGVDAKSLAVLPFDNLSADPENEFFADGMHDEIITQLVKIADLKVISRTSVMEYKGRKENLRDIAEELGVANIMEGTVRRADGQVRITTQLIDAATDEHLWAEAYDRDLSDVFAVQSDVAQQVAAALQARLTSAERQRIEETPTENLEAYDYYLRAIEYMERPGARPDDQENAQRMLERALELDPRFALAYATLSSLHVVAREYLLDRSEERLTRAREAADRALQIDPDLPEGHAALGYYYYAVRDYERALEEVAIAERGLPGSALLPWMRSWILKRQGKWEEALASNQRALALSPREPDPLFSLARTYFSLRRYEEAEAYFDRTLALQPDYVEARLFKAMVPFLGRGDTGPLRALVGGIPPGFDPSGYVVWALMVVEYYDRDYTEALEILSRSELRDIGSSPRTVWMGMCYANLGETDLARAAGDSALRELEAQLRERPDDPALHSNLAWAHFLLDDKEEAIAAAQRAVELMPISKDAVDGPGYVYNLANIHGRFGEAEPAVEHLERFLSVPSMTSVKYTQIDPAFDRVRDDPRFQALVAKYE